MIYQNQTFILTINTGLDLSEATDPKILYQKPNNDRGEWTAEISGNSLVYNVGNDDIDQDGVWKFQAFVQIDGENKFGKVVKQTIDEHL